MKSQLCKQVQINKSWLLGKYAVLIFKSQFAVKCFLFVAEKLSKDWLVENFASDLDNRTFLICKALPSTFFTVAVMKMVLSNYGDWRLKALK